MAKGLSLQDALRVVARLSADDGFRSRFLTDPHAAMSELGIDSQAALNGCATCPGLPSTKDMADVHDVLLGRLLTAHTAKTIHDPRVS